MIANSSEAGKKRVSLSIGESALKHGSQRAEKENRSFSNYVETLILRDCERLAPVRTDDEEIEGRVA